MSMNRAALAAIVIIVLAPATSAAAQATGPVYTCSKAVNLGGVSYYYKIASLRLLPGANWDVTGETMRFGGAFISVQMVRPFDIWTPTRAGQALTGASTVSQPTLSIVRHYRRRAGGLENTGVDIGLGMPNFIWGDSTQWVSRAEQKGRWLFRASGKVLMDVSQNYGLIARNPAYIESVASWIGPSSQPPARAGYAGFQPTLDGLAASRATLEIYDQGTLLGNGAIGPVRPDFAIFDQIAARETAAFARPGAANPNLQGCVLRR